MNVMAQAISASQLQTGDVYRLMTSRDVNGTPEAYVVSNVRTECTCETYIVVDAVSCRTGLGAQLNLIHDFSVQKLRPIGKTTLGSLLGNLSEGDTLMVTAYAGEFWW